MVMFPHQGLSRDFPPENAVDFRWRPAARWTSGGGRRVASFLISSANGCRHVQTAIAPELLLFACQRFHGTGSACITPCCNRSNVGSAVSRTLA